MTTLLPNPFVDETKPAQPVDRKFWPDEKLFMQCVFPDPLPESPPLFLDEPSPEYLRTLEDIANAAR